MNLNELSKEIHALAIEKGWWEENRTFGDIIALIHSEISECLEEYRNNRPLMYWWKDGVEYSTDFHSEQYDGSKPQGIAVELADCIIRILDYCAYANIDIEDAIKTKHEYNRTRPYRHGGKATI